MIERGLVHANREPSLVESLGALEQWDGELGPGMLNAHFAMSRAMDLASVHTIGAVGLRNTNHWMRGANYGWQAAEAGCIGVCWTNTQPNIAPWGGVRSAVGNNPLVVGILRKGGHVVLDMAMSQFSFGRLGKHARSGEPLPAVVGGVDASGEPTTDAAAIFNGGRVAPIGHWKGAGLALVLDLIAALVSGGRTTREIGELETEYGVSQMFIAINLSRLGDQTTQNALVDEAVEFVRSSGSDDGGEAAGPRYPGEASYARRRESEQNGVHVDVEVWRRIIALESTPRTS